MRYGKKTQIEARKAVDAFKLGEKLGLRAFENMREIVRLSKLHHSIQEHHCNGTCSARNEAKEKNIERKITKLAEELDLRVEFQGDPRGFTVRLHSKSIEKVWNTWGGSTSGYGVGEK